MVKPTEPGFEAGKLKQDLQELTLLSESFGNSLSRALAGAMVQGRSLQDVMRQLALSLARQTLTKSLSSLTDALVPKLTGSSGPPKAQAPMVNVTMNLTSPDADSFRRSERQVAAAAMRAMARGRTLL